MVQRERTLLINVDDIGIYDEAVEPALETIDRGVAASGSVMMVCPGTESALSFLSDRPEVPVGVHLTLTRDLPSWEWRPLTSGASIQRDGVLFPIEERDRLIANADPRDVAAEFRAQIERGLSRGVRLTHLDWHSLADGGRRDIFDLTLELAQEFGLRLRAWAEHGRSRLRSLRWPTQDQPFLDSFSLRPESKEAELIRRARELPIGVSEWAVHPAAEHPGDPGSPVRTSDREALVSDALRQVLIQEGVSVIGHGDL